MGHLGMLPQSVLEEGGYKIKGRSEIEHQALLEDARALEKAGAFSMVLELVTPPVAEEITARCSIPTLGIGCRTACDGQILVMHDLAGLFPWFTPRFVTPMASCAAEMRRAFTQWRREVESSPSPPAAQPPSTP